MSRTLPSLTPWPAGKPLPAGAITLFYDPATNQEYRVDLTSLGGTPTTTELSLAQLQALLVGGSGITIAPQDKKLLVTASTVAAAAPKAPAAPTNGQVDDTADTFSFLPNPDYPSFAQYKVAGLPGTSAAVSLNAANSYVQGARVYIKVAGAVAKGGLAVYVAGSGSVPDGQVLTNAEAFTRGTTTVPATPAATAFAGFTTERISAFPFTTALPTSYENILGVWVDGLLNDKPSADNADAPHYTLVFDADGLVTVGAVGDVPSPMPAGTSITYIATAGGSGGGTSSLTVSVNAQRLATISPAITASDYEYQFRPAPTVDAQRQADMSLTLNTGETFSDYEYQARS